MKSNHSLSPQFYTKDGVGLSLTNAAARKRMAALLAHQPHCPPGKPFTGDVVEDIIALGRRALIDHVDRWLENDPVCVIVKNDAVTIVRVCGALDYVIDHARHQVWVEAAPLSACAFDAVKQLPWPHPSAEKCLNIDLLNPLCKPMWLTYVAARPGWFSCGPSQHRGTQLQLFVTQDELPLILQMVVETAWHCLARSKAFIALRHLLATTLTLHLGPQAVNLAMRSRLRTDNTTLDARHMSLVLRHQCVFETMARENPKLLPGLTAWLQHDNNDSVATALNLRDALPLMRRALLANGLQPRAWRYLVQHGFKRLQPHHAAYAPWASMLKTLRALAASRWPALPPLGFLRLLHDTAGDALHYEQTSDHSAAGWFWELACNEAAACQSDTAGYSYLCDQIPQWAWMVRHYQLQPDKNQRRKGLEWLEMMSDVVHYRTLKETAPAWALWLPADGPQSSNADSYKCKVVPLQAVGALRAAAFALHNCADAFEDRCRSESSILLSVHLVATNKPVALISLKRRDASWVLDQVAGPCNRPVRAALQQLAQDAVRWVRYHHAQRAIAEAVAPEELPISYRCLHLIDP